MNANIARALLEDAWHQVLDNKVFRLLVLGTIGLIALTFLVGFKEDGISFLFGWKFVSYVEFARSFGGQIPQTKELNVAFIQGVQTIFVQGLAGSFGLMLCIAATAFFVPRMMERGEADVLFAKPVGRFVLLFARYVSGIVFVGLLALVLVVGMHLGFLVTSGYSDPAFLWSTLTLVYVFALVHAFSTTVAVLTRNAIAPVLLSLLFFMFNGCVHQGWILKEHAQERDRIKAEANESADGEKQAEKSAIVGILTTSLDALHYTLPKTNDADVLTQKLRRAVGGPEYILLDEAGSLGITKDPENFARDGDAELVDLSKTPATWISKKIDGSEAGRIVLSRRSRVLEETDKRGKPKRQSANQAALEALKQAEKLAGVDGRPRKEREAGRAIGIEFVRWTETREAAKVERSRAFFAIEDSMFELDTTLDASWLDQSTREARIEVFTSGFKPAQESAQFLEPDAWYMTVFGLDAPLKFNALFSIATSLAFAAAMLGIAQWRLSKIDF